MLERIITGGQTGADQAGWRAARAVGLATEGRMPRGFLTEDGPRPEFRGLYSASEDASDDPAARTVANVRAADATLVFAAARPGPGTALTIEAAHAAGVPHRVVPVDALPPAGEVAGWIAASGARTLNVAGDRESTAPGIGARVEAYLLDVFRLLGLPRRGGAEGPLPGGDRPSP